MNVVHSLSHTKWNCKYHTVFALKYRRKVFYEEKSIKNVVTKELGNIFIENEKEPISVVTVNDKNNNNNNNNYKVLAYTNNNTIKWKIISECKNFFNSINYNFGSTNFIIVTVTNLVLSTLITNSILNPIEM